MEPNKRVQLQLNGLSPASIGAASFLQAWVAQAPSFDDIVNLYRRHGKIKAAIRRLKRTIEAKELELKETYPRNPSARACALVDELNALAELEAQEIEARSELDLYEALQQQALIAAMALLTPIGWQQEPVVAEHADRASGASDTSQGEHIA